MSFIDLYNKIMKEATTRRVHAPYQKVIKTYKELLQSVGAYHDENLEDKTKVNALSDKTKYDSIKRLVQQEFKKDGVNKEYKENMKKDGYDHLIKILNELDLWREFPPAS
jgi:hypothetical protein